MAVAKVCVITGCRQGIGRATAHEFRKGGWKVVGLDIRPLGETDSGLFDLFLQVDVGQADQLQQAAQRIGSAHQAIGCFVNNAAEQVEKRLIDTSVEEWNRIMATNLAGPFFALKAFHSLLKGGAIVNISSVHARATSSGLGAYVASKGGLNAFTRAAALELAQDGIRVNCILPGAVDTDMLQRGLRRHASSAQALHQLVERTPLKKLGMAEDIAKLIFFLGNPEQSGNITGQEFICDGGVLARLASE